MLKFFYEVVELGQKHSPGRDRPSWRCRTRVRSGARLVGAQRRFAPGALSLVRNLPLRDKGTRLHGQYETPLGLSLSDSVTWASEGANSTADSNAFFASADAYWCRYRHARQPGLAESIETLLGGVHSLDYESEVDLPGHETMADGIGRRLIAILKRPESVWSACKRAAQGIRLALLSLRGAVIQKLMRTMQVAASLREHGLAVLGNRLLTGVERGSPGWGQIRTFAPRYKCCATTGINALRIGCSCRHRPLSDSRGRAPAQRYRGQVVSKIDAAGGPGKQWKSWRSRAWRSSSPPAQSSL